MSILDSFMFTYRDKEYDLHEIIGKENILDSKEFGKPIILKGGIFKLCQHFNFKDHNYNITWIETSSGTICTCLIDLTASSSGVGTSDYDYQFIGDGEANRETCKGIAAAHMQAMAIKRARSRAVLQELGIDAYGEEEAQGFEKTIHDEKALKTFLADEITNLAAMFDTPMEKEALRNNIKSHFGLGPEDQFTANNLDASKLIEFYGKLYHQLQMEEPEAK